MIITYEVMAPLIVNAAQHKVLHRSLSCEAGEGVRVWGCGGGCGGLCCDALREIESSGHESTSFYIWKYIRYVVNFEAPLPLNDMVQDHQSKKHLYIHAHTHAHTQ